MNEPIKHHFVPVFYLSNWCESDGMVAFFKICALTGQRRSEVAAISWKHIDPETKVWTLPREMTKSDRAHEVPLSPQVVEILKALPRWSSGLIFTTNEKTPISGFSKAKKQCDLEFSLAGLSKRKELTLKNSRERAARRHYLNFHNSLPGAHMIFGARRRQGWRVLAYSLMWSRKS